MRGGRNPVCAYEPLDGEESTHGDTNNLRPEDNQSAPSTQPKNEKFVARHAKTRTLYKRKSTKRTWHVLEEWLRRVRAALTTPYDHPMYNGLHYHANGRRKRYERVHAEVDQILCWLVANMCLGNMEAGYADRDRFINYNYADIAKHTGLSINQVEDYMPAIQRAGFAHVRTLREQRPDENGVLRWATYKTIITITDKLFEMFNLERELATDRKRYEKYIGKQMLIWLKTRFKRMQPPTAHKKSLFKKFSDQLSINKAVKTAPNRTGEVQQAVARLMRQEPSLSLKEAVQRVVRQLSAKPPPD